MFGDPVQNEFDWKILKLKIVSSKIGSGATPRGGKESYQDAGVSLVRSMNVYDDHFEYKDLAHLTDTQADALRNVKIEENDILFNITGASVARSCIVPKDILPARVNQHVSIIRCKTDLVTPIFINKTIINNSFKNMLLTMSESGGATRQAITKDQLEQLDIIIPPLKMQSEFANFVDQVDKSKFVLIKWRLNMNIDQYSENDISEMCQI
jgi:Restriction endonuclease S subunits